MKEDYTHILFIIDDSGSMRSVLDDSIGGFNSFVEEQRKVDGECRMHTMKFGSAASQEYIHEDMDVNDIPELTEKEHNAGSGMTALLDSIGMGIDRLGNFLRKKEESERPSKVMVNIFTDGAENDSNEYTKELVEDMIKEQTEKYGWEFTFLASDIQASNLASAMGISNVANAAKGGKGMRAAYSAISLNSTMYRSVGDVTNVQEAYDKAESEDTEN